MNTALLQLLATNKGRGQFRVENSAADEATIYLYDIIVSDPFWGGVAAIDFVKELAAIKAGTIHLRINSPGGDVFAAQAMAQAIREHPANIIAHVDGYAASAATYPALAADETVIAEGGFFMIHKAMTMAYGNSDEMLATADLLNKVDASLLALYASATGKDEQQIRDWMAAETWFSAADAVAQGFADRVAQAPAKKTANLATWNLSAYAHAPALPEPDANDKAAPAASVVDTEHLRRRLRVAEKQAA